METSRRTGSQLRIAFLLVLVSALALVVASTTGAHKPVTSKYDYNKDVFPLLRDHCGRCHVQGGPAPMSLMSYKDAAPWAESIRDEITAGRMPPWPVDPMSPLVKGGYPISSRDLDRIAVWASGGTPEGNPNAKLPDVSFSAQWKLGPPDLKITLDKEYSLAPGMIEQTIDVSLPVNVAELKWIKAADLMPGTASIARDAVISIENGPILALWQPGSDTVAAPSGAAFQIAPGSKIHLQLHYKKHFDQEQNAVADKSTIGLYFTDPPASGRGLQSMTIDGTALTAKVAGASRILALRPMLDRAYQSLNVEAITPSGTHIPLLRLQGPRPQWFRRYWLQEAVELAAGSQIQVSVTPLSDYSDEPKAAKRFPLEIGVDFSGIN